MLACLLVSWKKQKKEKKVFTKPFTKDSKSESSSVTDKGKTIAFYSCKELNRLNIRIVSSTKGMEIFNLIALIKGSWYPINGGSYCLDDESIRRVQRGRLA